VLLAAHAVENAKRMLGSGLSGPGGLVGRNLMHHADVLSWALLLDDPRQSS